jgi:hypothetical protein
MCARCGWPLVMAVLLLGGSTHASEPERVQRHLDGALEMLSSRDLLSLSPAQRDARERNVERLKAYRNAGMFPKNRDFPGRFVPYFRDADGTLCAMAHLIAESGGTEIVDHVARTRNNATVHELADEPGLAEWLDANGLTLEEAARIQPYYSGIHLRFETERRVLQVGACSGPIAYSVKYTDGSRPSGTAYLQVSPDTGAVSLFQDTECAVPLQAQLTFRDGLGRFSIRGTEAGSYDLTLSYNHAHANRTLTIDDEPPNGGAMGCFSAPAAPWTGTMGVVILAAARLCWRRATHRPRA